MESLSFRQLTSEPHQFFDMLPSEWQKEIAPFWNDYESVAKIYVIEEDDVIIGGGIMFSACPPNFTYLRMKPIIGSAKATYTQDLFGLPSTSAVTIQAHIGLAN